MKVDEILEIRNNEFLRQFEADIEGEKVVLEYAEQPRKIFLTKLIVGEEMVEEGMDELFLRSIFEKLAEGRERVVPTCPKVVKFFKAHRKEYRKLLPVGINL